MAFCRMWVPTPQLLLIVFWGVGSQLLLARPPLCVGVCVCGQLPSQECAVPIGFEEPHVMHWWARQPGRDPEG